MGEIPPQQLNAMVATGGRTELTDQERRVLEYASHGLEREMIADAMNLSVETIKTHLRNARYLTKGHNTTHACCNALRRGWIE